jgi:hypothetical protein
VAGDPALYVVTLVNSPFFLKTCEVNEKKRKIKRKRERERVRRRRSMGVTGVYFSQNV